jgi:hypothetical protein
VCRKSAVLAHFKIIKGISLNIVLHDLYGFYYNIYVLAFLH